MTGYATVLLDSVCYLSVPYLVETLPGRLPYIPATATVGHCTTPPRQLPVGLFVVL